MGCGCKKKRAHGVPLKQQQTVPVKNTQSKPKDENK